MRYSLLLYCDKEWVLPCNLNHYNWVYNPNVSYPYVTYESPNTNTWSNTNIGSPGLGTLEDINLPAKGNTCGAENHRTIT